MTTSRQLAHSHPRLVAAMVAGLILGMLLPSSWSELTRLLAGWSAAAWAYVVLMGWMMARASRDRVRQTAEVEDTSHFLVLVTLSAAAVASLAAVVLELATAKGLPGGERLLHYGLTAFTVAGSWLLVGTVYAFHYAHLFYRSPPGARALGFPDAEENPDYWDFLYFSFNLAVAGQTSDVTVLSGTMRKAVLAQSILSFVFNVAIIGMMINIAAGMVAS
jgi:uncharacterized membrane protein